MVIDDRANITQPGDLLAIEEDRGPLEEYGHVAAQAQLHAGGHDVDAGALVNLREDGGDNLLLVAQRQGYRNAGGNYGKHQYGDEDAKESHDRGRWPLTAMCGTEVIVARSRTPDPSLRLRTSQTPWLPPPSASLVRAPPGARSG